MCKSAIKLLCALASLKLTLLGIVALLAGVLLSYFIQGHPAIYIILPLAILAVNLFAAIIFKPRIRQNTGLLMFHICLLMLALLALLSQLSSMKGRVEVTQGTEFDVTSVTVTEQGPWHSSSRLQQVEFIQGDIKVAYGKGLRRESTRSRLQLVNVNDSVVVGDNVAFKSHGYRFYTTSNKGYAAIVNWYAKDGSVEKGAIHFPSYPLYDWKQENEWKTPSGEQLKLKLLIDTGLNSNSEWILQSANNGYLELTMLDGIRHTVAPGEYIELENGALEFESIRMWMGYKIFYDRMLTWFLAVALAGVLGIAWHYYLKLSSPGKRFSLVVENAGIDNAVTTTQS